MKVLVVHNRYRSTAPSGENRVVEQESAALSALGHQVSRFDRCSDEIEGWSAPRRATLPVRVVWSGEAHRALAGLLHAERPDVVHVHNTFPLISPAVLYACHDAGVPVVATLHNYKLMCASGDFFRAGQVCHDCASGWPVHGVLRSCYRGSAALSAPVAVTIAAHRRAWRQLVSAYVFISASQRDLLAGLRLPAERVFVKHNLVPPMPGRTAQLAEPGEVGELDESRRPSGPGGQSGPGEAYVLYAGRLDRAKGIPVLMAGWDRYLATQPRPGLRLRVVGAGPLSAEVAVWSGTRASVSVHGQVSQAELADLIARARAVLLPSAWEETFGLVAVEAMAAGVPPVAADHGSFVELITHDHDGTLFRHGDPAALAAALVGVEADPDRYTKLGAAARDTYLRRHQPERNIAELVRIYDFARTHPA